MLFYGYCFLFEVMGMLKCLTKSYIFLKKAKKTILWSAM